MSCSGKLGDRHVTLRIMDLERSVDQRIMELERRFGLLAEYLRGLRIMPNQQLDHPNLYVHPDLWKGGRPQIITDVSDRPKLELPEVIYGDTPKFAARFGNFGMDTVRSYASQGSSSASAYASMCNRLSFLSEEKLWATTSRRRKGKSSNLPKQVTQFITRHRLARKVKQRSKCQTRNNDRREKQLQRQDYWLPTASSQDSDDDDMDKLYPYENWIEVARFRSFPERLITPGGATGFFLMVNPKANRAVLQRYESWEGHSCETCSFRDMQCSDNGRDDVMQCLLEQELLADGRVLRASNVVPCEEMYRRAELCVDPDMHLRILKAGEKDFQAVSTLYAVYRAFYEQVMCDTREWWVKSNLRKWRCRMWNARTLKGVARLQALYRGWACRKRVGFVFSPNCELGRRLLMLRWKRWSDSPHKSSNLMQ